MDLEYGEIYLDSSDAINVTPLYATTDFYVINSENNTFTLTEVTSDTVTIPVGNYTSVTLPTALAAALTSASPGTRTYTVTYSATTQKFTITANSGTFSLALNAQLQLILGMSATPSSSGSVLVSPNAVQITGPNYMYLNSDQLGSLFQTYLPTTATNFSPSKGPQIACIPIDVNPGEIVYYTDPAPEKWFDTQNLMQLQIMDLYWTMGNTNQKVRLNGQSFSIKLGLLLYPDVNNRVKQNASNSGVRMVLG